MHVARTGRNRNEVVSMTRTYQISHPIVPRVVTDQQALTACFDFLYDHRVMVEPACGASLATIYQADPFLRSMSNVVVIVCGGVGVSNEQLNLWQAELI